MSFIKSASITLTLINVHGRYGVDKYVNAAKNVVISCSVLITLGAQQTAADYNVSPALR